MEFITGLTELASACLGIGGLLVFVAWVIGSVIHMLTNIMKKGV